MDLLVFLLFTSCFSLGLAHEGEGSEHRHSLPETCNDKDFFVVLLEEEGCQPCACRGGVWDCLTPIYIPDVCCKKFGKSCHSTQCEVGDSSIIIEEDFCATCDCVEGYWDCKRWHSSHDSCTIFDKLCECHTGDTKTVPKDDDSCYRCSCKKGFWNCNLNTTFTKDYCCDNWGVQCPHCCADGRLGVHLKHKPVVAGSLDSVEVIIDDTVNPTCEGDANCQCSATALVKIEFEKIEPHCGCGKEPMCGRRQLRIDLKLNGGRREGIYLNIGDSPFNSGKGGDATTDTKYDAEVVAENFNLHIFQNENCNYGEITYEDVFEFDSDAVRFYIGNEFMKIYSKGELQESMCDNCLFGLDKQAEDDFIYVGLNRAVDGSSKGVGICDAWFHWVCPSRKEDWVNYTIREK